MPTKKRKNKDPSKIKDKATKPKSRDKSASQVKETLSSQLRKQVGVVKTSTPALGMFLHSRPTEKETCQKEHSPNKTTGKKTTKKSSKLVSDILDQMRDGAHKPIDYSPPPPSLITPTSDHKEELEPAERRDAGESLFKHFRTVLSSDVGSLSKEHAMSNPDQPCVAKTKLWESVVSSAWQAHDSLVTSMGSLLHQGRATSLDRKCVTGSTSHDLDLSMGDSSPKVRRRNKRELASTCGSIDETASLSNEVSFLTAMRNHIAPPTNEWPMLHKKSHSESAGRKSVSKENTVDSPFKTLSRGPSGYDCKMPQGQESTICNPQEDMIFTPSATTLLHKYDPLSSIVKTPETTEEWDEIEDYIPKRETTKCVGEHKSGSIQMQNRAVSPFVPTPTEAMCTDKSRRMRFNSLTTKEVMKKRSNYKSRSPRRSPRRNKKPKICASRSDNSIAKSEKLPKRDMKQNELLLLVLEQLNKQQAELKFHRKWMHNLSKERKGVVDKICNKLDKQVDLLQSELLHKESQRQLDQRKPEHVEAPLVEDTTKNERQICEVGCGETREADNMGVIFNRIQEALTKTTDIVMRAKESHSPKKGLISGGLIVGRETPFYDTLDTIVETDREDKAKSENTNTPDNVPDKAVTNDELVHPPESPPHKHRSRMSACSKSKRSRSAEQRKSNRLQKLINKDSLICNGTETSSLHSVVCLQRAHSELPFTDVQYRNTLEGSSQNAMTDLPSQDKNIDVNADKEVLVPIHDVQLQNTNTTHVVVGPSLQDMSIPYNDISIPYNDISIPYNDISIPYNDISIPCSEDFTLRSVLFQDIDSSSPLAVEENAEDVPMSVLESRDEERSGNVEENTEKLLSLLDSEDVKQPDQERVGTKTPVDLTHVARFTDATVESRTPLSILPVTDIEQSEDINVDAHTLCSELVSELADFEHLKGVEVNGDTPLSVFERLLTECDTTEVKAQLPQSLYGQSVTLDRKCQMVQTLKPLSGLPPKLMKNAQRAKSTLPFKDKKRNKAIINHAKRPQSAIPFIANINMNRFNSILVNTQRALSIMSLQDTKQANNEACPGSPGSPFENMSQNKFIDKDQESGVISFMEFNDSKEFSFVKKKSMFDANDSEASLVGLPSFKHSPDRLPFLVTTPTIGSCSDSSMTSSESYSFDSEDLTSMTQDSADDSFREGFFFENMESKSSLTVVSDDLGRKPHSCLFDDHTPVDNPRALADGGTEAGGGQSGVELVTQRDSQSGVSEKTDHAFRSWTSVTQSSMTASEHSGRPKRFSRFTNRDTPTGQNPNPPSFKKLLNVLVVASMMVIMLWIIVDNKKDVLRTLSYYYHVYQKEERHDKVVYENEDRHDNIEN